MLQATGQKITRSTSHIQSQIALNMFGTFSKQFGFGCKKLIELSSVPSFRSIPFSYGIGLPLLINSRFDWKSSYEKCFSLVIESSIFVVNVKYKKSNGRTSINPTGEAEVLFAISCLPPLRVFSLRFYVRSARLNRFYACAQPSLWGIAQSEMRHSSSLPHRLLSVWTGHAQILTDTRLTQIFHSCLLWMAVHLS